MNWARVIFIAWAVTGFGVAFAVLLLLKLYLITPDWFIGMTALVLCMALGAVWTLFDELRIEADMEDDDVRNS